MTITLRLLNSAGVESYELPDIETVTLSPVFCDAGTIEFSYPTDGVNFSQIRSQDEFRVNVYVDGVKVADSPAWIKDIDGDDVTESGAWKFSGWLNNGRLNEAVIYPDEWPNYDEDEPGQFYTDNTPGYFFMKIIENEAQQRGALAGIFLDNIDPTHDSEGKPWERLITQELKPGTTYLEVMTDLYEDGVCEWQIVGNKLEIYNYQGLAVDHTVGGNPVTFRMGRDLIDAPRKRSSREWANSLLIEGGEGVYTEQKDTPAINALRRIEGTYSNSELTRLDLLGVYGMHELAKRKYAKFEVSHGLALQDPDSPRPMIDFDVGDWVYSDTGAGLERLRVRQWVLAQNADGTVTGSVVLNDLFPNRAVRLRQDHKKVVKGKTKVGTSKKRRPAVPKEAVDNKPPAAPTNVAANSVAYVQNGQYFAAITATWAQVSTNIDGTALSDLSGYRVSYQQNGAGWSPGMNAGLNTSLRWAPVTPSTLTDIRVAAFDKWGNQSPWSAPIQITTLGDVTPPPVPSTPLVDNYAGMLRVRWDGAFAASATKPVDFSYVEVHVGTASTFTPVESTLISQLRAGGSAFITSPYGATRYAKLVSVDLLGNKSAATAAVPGVTSQVVDTDIFDGAIGSSKLADLAVITAKIADLAVNDAKIGSLGAGKITAGVVTAQVTVSGRLTSALTGQRSELNSLGIQAFNAAGTLTVDLNGVTNTMMGLFRTAFSGRRIEIGAAGLSGEMALFAPDGKKGFVRGYTQTTGQEAVQIGMSLTGAVDNSLWNRITINSSTAGEFSTYRSGSHEFIYDSTAPNTSGRYVVYQTASRGDASTDIRMLINNNGMTSWYPIAGIWSVYDRSDATNVARARIYIYNPSTHFYHLSGGDTTVYENVGGSNIGRMQIGDTEVWFKWPTNGNQWKGFARIRRSEDASGNSSAELHMMNAHGFGGMMAWRSGSAYENPRMEFTESTGSNYIGIWASAFDVHSSAASKKSIRKSGPMSEIMRGAKVKRYAMRGDRSRERIGLIVEEAPAAFQVRDEEDAPKAVDLYALTCGTLAYVQELEARVAQLEREKA